MRPTDAASKRPAGESVRARLNAALAGERVEWPVFAVYDWFVENRDIDWPSLFERGLGQINHATITQSRRPNVEIVETTSRDVSGRVRRDVRWVTDVGELKEWYLGEWRQEHLIKKPGDYRILARALSDVEITAVPGAFAQSGAALGENGVTLGVPESRRTAFQAIQIDLAGLERFSIDVALGCPELLDLIEVMNELTYREFEVMATMPVSHIKLWENLSIETMGPSLYRKHLVPVYERILGIASGSGQRLCVHYDGKLRVIAEDIRRLPFDGLDSVTPPPEGDLSTAEARELWPDKFLWLHPSLGWYRQPEEKLVGNVLQMAEDAGPTRYCLMISEEVPDDWERTIPLILRALR